MQDFSPEGEERDSQPSQLINLPFVLVSVHRRALDRNPKACILPGGCRSCPLRWFPHGLCCLLELGVTIAARGRCHDAGCGVAGTDSSPMSCLRLGCASLHFFLFFFFEFAEWPFGCWAGLASVLSREEARQSVCPQAQHQLWFTGARRAQLWHQSLSSASLALC